MASNYFRKTQMRKVSESEPGGFGNLHDGWSLDRVLCKHLAYDFLALGGHSVPGQFPELERVVLVWVMRLCNYLFLLGEGNENTRFLL